ncbi:MAG: hypothetical protein N2645_01255 [Clostridia bacterium]|nr:hypothetical protein [Clostridia bacterium]
MIVKRPVILTVLCLLSFAFFLARLFEYFAVIQSLDFNMANIRMELLFLLVALDILVVVSTFGVLGMKKWGIILFAVSAVASEISFTYSYLFIPSLIIFLTVIMIGFINFKRMA